MDEAIVETRPSVDLSLRWKALIAMTLALVLVNASLALIANFQLAGQFELQQSAVRDQQARQLRALVEEGTQEMSKLASLVPLLGGNASDMASPADQIRQALLTNGAMLDLEWDIRSVHWITTRRHHGHPLAGRRRGYPERPARRVVADTRACDRCPAVQPRMPPVQGDPAALGGLLRRQPGPRSVARRCVAGLQRTDRSKGRRQLERQRPIGRRLESGQLELPPVPRRHLSGRYPARPALGHPRSDGRRRRPTSRS